MYYRSDGNVGCILAGIAMIFLFIVMMRFAGYLVFSTPIGIILIIYLVYRYFKKKKEREEYDNYSNVEDYNNYTDEKEDYHAAQFDDDEVIIDVNDYEEYKD